MYFGSASSNPAVKELLKSLRTKNVDLYIAGAIGPVRDRLKTSGIQEALGTGNFFFDVEDAVAYYADSGKSMSERKFSPLQSNV